MSDPAFPMTDAQRQTDDWNPMWDRLAELDPDFLEAFLAFRTIPKKKGPLPTKYKELVMVAINVATTHLWGPGARRHMHNALQAGATRDEILEVMQLTTVMGIHSMALGLPILDEVLQQHEAQAGSAP